MSVEPKGGKMKLKETVIKGLDILAQEYPEARGTLDFKNPLELLIATILAAQCTDERVNRVTKDLFRKYRTAVDYARANPKKFEEEIRSTGFFRNKAKNIIHCCRKIDSQFNGRVPQTIEDLTSLPGVGRKTANILLGNAFGKQAIAVDTHVKRVTHRLGWAKSEDPDKIEFELMEVMPPERWTLTCHQLVFHGRKICTARNPQCPVCAVAKFCPKIGVTGEN
jgi:endonuclease-3